MLAQVNTSALGEIVTTNTVIHALLSSDVNRTDRVHARTSRRSAGDDITPSLVADPIPPRTASVTYEAGDGVNAITHRQIQVEKLHIRDFYLFHMMRICEGDFTRDGSRNVTACHPYFSKGSGSLS